MHLIAMVSVVYLQGVEQSYRGVSREIAVEGLEQTAILMVRPPGCFAPDWVLTANLTLGNAESGRTSPGDGIGRGRASIGQPAMTELVQRLGAAGSGDPGSTIPETGGPLW